MLRKLLVALGAFFVLALALFCATLADDGSTLIFENELTETIDVYGERSIIADNLEPGERYKHVVLPYDSIETYEARSQTGEELARVSVSWSELQGRDFRIVFK